MKFLSLFSLVAAIFLCQAPLQADVKITQLDDRFRVEVDGKLFTEWQHKAWAAPYLYPVIGPNGENITRHYPMMEGVPGESTDHAHHRSIFFSHRGINGYSFWGPDYDKEKRATIVLEKVEKIEGGEKSGELIIWNKWLGDGKLILRERLRLVFTPLKNHEMLMDYDTTLQADGEDAVTFKDEKDGGLGIRVAATMKVADRKTKTGKGTILNSRGDKNADAWGKRAEWADYFGPDATGKIVGIATFDHPSNLRYPTHWHARTYGLITANRFGTGHFDAKSGAKKGDGEYTIPKGEKIKLRHRLFFHHGSSEEAKVADQYKNYLEK